MKIPSKPFSLDSKAHLKVRYIFERNDHELENAILDLVCGEKTRWTPSEWKVVINHITSSDLTVGEYIKPYTEKSA
jgi:hypothetical protein